MSPVLRTVIVAPDNTLRRELRLIISALETVQVEAEWADYDGFSFSADAPNVALIDVDADTERALELVTRLARQGQCGVCAVSRFDDGQRVLRAIRAGAHEFLTLPIPPRELRSLLRSAAARGQVRDSAARGSTMVAVAGASGGVGSTSIAVNLSSILAAHPESSVVLLDLDLVLGDVDVFLDMTYEHTLADLVRNVSRLDAELLRRSLARHDCGLHLLPRPAELSDAWLVTETALRRVLTLLKESSSHVVVDLSKAYSPLDMAALECCDVALLVTQLDLPGLRNVVRLLKSFRLVPGLSEKLRLVVNRVLPDAETIRVKRAEEIVGHEIFWQVPNDYRLMIDTRNNGVPLISQAPKAEITQSLAGLARALTGERAVEDQPTMRTPSAAPMLSKWLGFWSSGGPRAQQPVS